MYGSRRANSDKARYFHCRYSICFSPWFQRSPFALSEHFRRQPSPSRLPMMAFTCSSLIPISVASFKMLMLYDLL